MTSLFVALGESQFEEWVEYFESRTTEVFVVAGDDGELVAAGGGGDVAVFDGHALTGFGE